MKVNMFFYYNNITTTLHFKLEGCALNSEKTAITLNSDVTNAKVTLVKNTDDRKGVAGSEFIVQFSEKVNNIEKEDNTTAGEEIPQAGQSMIVIISILTIVLMVVVSYVKLNKFKDVK